LHVAKTGNGGTNQETDDAEHQAGIKRGGRRASKRPVVSAPGKKAFHQEHLGVARAREALRRVLNVGPVRPGPTTKRTRRENRGRLTKGHRTWVRHPRERLIVRTTANVGFTRWKTKISVPDLTQKKPKEPPHNVSGLKGSTPGGERQKGSVTAADGKKTADEPLYHLIADGGGPG